MEVKAHIDPCLTVIPGCFIGIVATGGKMKLSDNLFWTKTTLVEYLGVKSRL
jgi:hypothetical protein